MDYAGFPPRVGERQLFWVGLFYHSIVYSTKGFLSFSNRKQSLNELDN